MQNTYTLKQVVIYSPFRLSPDQRAIYGESGYVGTAQPQGHEDGDFVYSLFVAVPGHVSTSAPAFASVEER
jgi:hypothetical protein